MKKIFLFVTIFLSISSMRFASAAPVLPIVSDPADPQNATWYYIKFDRQWPASSGNQYLYDLGAGRPLITVPALSNTADGILWKVEKTDTDGEYKIVSKLGNTFEYTATAITGVAADRFYSTPTSTATYGLIQSGTTDFCALTITINGNVRGLNKTNNDKEVCEYSATDAGGRLSFITPSAVTAVTTKSLTSTATSLAFGNVTIDLLSDTKTVSMFGYNLTDFTGSLTGSDKFILDSDPSTVTLDGSGVVYAKFNVYCAPTIAGALSATVSLTTNTVGVSSSPISIALTANGEDTELPDITLSTENADNETWYYIYHNKRMGFVMQDMGLNAKIEARPVPVAATPDPAQLWKIVSTGISGRYKLISKNGRGIAYSPANSFTATATVTNTQTFYFVKNTVNNINSWGLFSNQAGSQMNKTENSLVYTNYGNNTNYTDYGNSVEFILPENIDATDVQRPLNISTDGNNYWYSIGFSNGNYVLQDNGVNALITQITKPTSLLTANYWKITGTWDDFKIKAYSGLEAGFTESGNDDIRMKSLNSGDSFKLIGDYRTYQNKHHYVLVDNDHCGSPNTRFFVNSRHPQVGTYSASDGNNLTFTLITNAVTVTADANINNATITAPAGALVGSAFNLPYEHSVTLTYQVADGYTPTVTVNGTEANDAGTENGGIYTLTVSNITAATTIAITAVPNPPNSLFGVVTDDSNAPIRYYNLQGIEVSTPVKGNVYIVKQGTKVTKQLVK